MKKLKSGKVREVFDLGDFLLFVATDRISAFDVILPKPITEKGRILTALIESWFGKTSHIAENNFITSDFDKTVAAVYDRRQNSTSAAGTAAATSGYESLRGRSMLVRKCRPSPSNAPASGHPRNTSKPSRV